MCGYSVFSISPLAMLAFAQHLLETNHANPSLDCEKCASVIFTTPHSPKAEKLISQLRKQPTMQTTNSSFSSQELAHEKVGQSHQTQVPRFTKIRIF